MLKSKTVISHKSPKSRQNLKPKVPLKRKRSLNQPPKHHNQKKRTGKQMEVKIMRRMMINWIKRSHSCLDRLNKLQTRMMVQGLSTPAFMHKILTQKWPRDTAQSMACSIMKMQFVSRRSSPKRNDCTCIIFRHLSPLFNLISFSEFKLFDVINLKILFL